MQGEVDVTGGEGLVSLRSVQGSVRLKGAKGRIDVNSVNEDVRVSDASGEIVAETVNGEIVLERVDATSLEATTVNGDVGYDGPIRNGGRYTLSSHNGDVTLAMPECSSATVSVSTFNGEFESEFPVTLREARKGKRFSFTHRRRQRPGVAGIVSGHGPARPAGASAASRGVGRPRQRPRRPLSLGRYHRALRIMSERARPSARFLATHQNSNGQPRRGSGYACLVSRRPDPNRPPLSR